MHSLGNTAVENILTKKERVIGGWGWAGHVTFMRKLRNDYKIVIVKPEGKRSLARPNHMREDNKIY
jgi:hypothetical protein